MAAEHLCTEPWLVPAAVPTTCSPPQNCRGLRWGSGGHGLQRPGARRGSRAALCESHETAWQAVWPTHPVAACPQGPWVLHRELKQLTQQPAHTPPVGGPPHAYGGKTQPSETRRGPGGRGLRTHQPWEELSRHRVGRGAGSGPWAKEAAPVRSAVLTSCQSIAKLHPVHQVHDNVLTGSEERLPGHVPLLHNLPDRTSTVDSTPRCCHLHEISPLFLAGTPKGTAPTLRHSLGSLLQRANVHVLRRPQAHQLQPMGL